ncbi:MAG TPA: hypothetical protein VGZ22_25650 [Isosphaeraceae bacterium]|jgi:signal recognition particle subunit SRP54|nr:hypothetical protein [Isosphaeraceae bacterium]
MSANELTPDNDRDDYERLTMGDFDLEVFRRQIEQVRKMGPLSRQMKEIPGIGRIAAGLAGFDVEGEIGRIQGIIDSMTPAERHDPRTIDRDRRLRIAKGAGVNPADVLALVKQFAEMAALVKQFATIGRKGKAAARPGQVALDSMRSALQRDLMLWEFIADD